MLLSAMCEYKDGLGELVYHRWIVRGAVMQPVRQDAVSNVCHV